MIRTFNLTLAVSAKPVAKRALALATLLAVVCAQSQTPTPKAEAPQIKVGDQWRLEQKDKRTGIREAETFRTVTTVGQNAIEGIENDGKFSMTSELNLVESTSTAVTGEARFLNFPLEAGKKWSFKYAFSNKTNPNKGRVQLDAEVLGYEKITVAAGSFDAFRIEAKGFWNNDTTRGNGRSKSTYWYAPAARAVVRFDYEDGYNNWTRELIEYKLQP